MSTAATFIVDTYINWNAETFADSVSPTVS